MLLHLGTYFELKVLGDLEDLGWFISSVSYCYIKYRASVNASHSDLFSLELFDTV